MPIIMNIYETYLKKTSEYAGPEFNHNCEDVLEILEYCGLEKSEYSILCFTGDMRLISATEVTINEPQEDFSHLEEVFKEALKNNASSIIVSAKRMEADIPNERDLKLAKDLLYICKLIGIYLFDYFIFSSQGYTSLRVEEYIRTIEEDNEHSHAHQ